jgi:microsomal dipeptidase-like Zn-dependent dipeptidase
MPVLIDGLQCGYFNREVFQELRRGSVTCVTITLGFWERCVETMDRIARWRDMERENADLILIARGVADIDRAAREERTAIVLGSQNAELFEGRIRFIELFAELGVRVVQLTYNNQNELGGSCYEQEDSGLSRFGRDVVREMNRAGIVVDLSHVGNRTTLDAIRWARKPVAISHANADSLFPHKRNKTDDVLRALRDNGGVIGCAAYRNITGDYFCSSLDAWCEMVKRTVDIIGIDHVGIGTDRSHGHAQIDLDWMRMGRWTRAIDYGAGSAAKPGKTPPADWLKEVHQLGDVPAALTRAGFTKLEADKIAFGNWRRLYAATFPA